MESNRKFRRSRPFWQWIPLIVVAGIVSIFVVAYFFGTFPSNSVPPFYYFPWWIIFPIFFFGLFFFASWRWSQGCWWGYGRGGYYAEDRALETLRERFARSEITKEQYEQMRRDLEVT